MREKSIRMFLLLLLLNVSLISAEKRCFTTWSVRGATSFSPQFDYSASKHNLYFTESAAATENW